MLIVNLAPIFFRNQWILLGVFKHSCQESTQNFAYLHTRLCRPYYTDESALVCQIWCQSVQPFGSFPKTLNLSFVLLIDT